LYDDIPDDIVVGKEDLFDQYFNPYDGNKQHSKTSRVTGYGKPGIRFIADDDVVIIAPSGNGERTKLKSYGDEISPAMTSRQNASDVTKIEVGDSNISTSRSGGKPNRGKSGEGKHRPRKHRESSSVSGMREDGVEQQQKLTGLEQTDGSKNTGSAASQQNNQRSTLRSCVYYQNRFIVLDPHEGRRSTEGYTNNSQQNRGSRDRASNSPRAGDQDSNEETSFSTSKRRSGKMSDIQSSRKPGNRRNMEMDASSVTMDARGIEIILTDPENSSRHIAAENKEKNNTVWKKINRFLQDNRMKGNPDSDRILNTDRPEDYRVLKKVLNLSFLTIGILLFLAVIVVVIYAFVGKSIFSSTCA